MCYVQNCQNNNAPANLLIGPRIDVCEEHFNECRLSIQQSNPALTDGYVTDYARLVAIIQNKQVVGEALDSLAIPLRTFAREAHEGEDLPDIHWLLKRREVEFGFNPRDIIMTGILDGAWFLRQLVDGYAAVDYGADADHGPFTHRFQWYAIMYVWSDGFQRAADNPAGGWQHTPIELYTLLGDATTLNRTPIRQFNSGVPYPGSSLWAAMFDLGGHTYYNYAFPDVLHKHLRNANSNLLADAELRNSVLDLQRKIVDQRVRVLTRLEAVGAVKPNRDGSRIKERPEEIQAAVTGANILGTVRYDQDVDILPDVAGGPAQKAMALVNKEYMFKLVGSGLWEEIGVNLIGRVAV